MNVFVHIFIEAAPNPRAESFRQNLFDLIGECMRFPSAFRLHALFSLRFLIVILILFSQVAVLPATQPVAAAENSSVEPVPVSAEETIPFMAPSASVSVSAPSEVPLGQNVSFSVTFDNTGADPGYGPFVEVILDRTGADGIHPGTPAANAYDGLSTTTAVTITYAGIAIPTSDISILTFDSAGNITHPLVRNASGNFITVNASTYGAAPGDKMIVVRLPFGSFTPAQPEATVDLTVNMSNLADVGTPLSIWARGGYQYGTTPLDDFCCGDLPANTLGTVSSTTITPRLLIVSKEYNGPEDETATGPNFPRSYTLTADLPAGQTITNLNLTDVLPDNIQFISVSSSPVASSSSLPSTNTPGGTLTLTYASVSTDITITVNFYVPRLDASSGDVIDPVSGDDVTSTNSVSATGDWLPTDTRDQSGSSPFTISVTGDCPGCPHTLTDKSIAIQKSVSGASVPGATLTYTLNFQISDFFAFDDIVITDVISDGQRLSSTPTLQVNGNGYTIAAGNFSVLNYDVDCHYTVVAGGGTGAECETNSGTTGTTELIFRVSDQIEVTQANGFMVGGCVDPNSPFGLISPCDTSGAGDGPTTGTIVFQTTIQERFANDFPSGDPSVDQGDLLENNVTILGGVLDVTTLTPNGEDEEDDSHAEIILPTGALTKEIYAVNGSTSLPSTVSVKPGDTVTYRLTYDLPISDEENLELTDYLPLPVFHVGDADEDGSAGPSWTFDPTVSATVPAVGVGKFGPADTFYAYSGLAPAVTSANAENSLTFTYGDFDDPADTATTVDILFTITVSTDPFADGLYLTNQAHAFEGSTNGGLIQANSIVQIVLTEPVLTNTKTVFWTDSSSGVYSSPVGGGGVTIQPPASSPRWTGTINSNYLNSNPLDADISQVDAGDIVSFAIIIENSGSSLKGAFDLQLQDTLQPQFDIPSGGLNLQVYYGNGSGGMISYQGLTTNCVANTPNDACGEEIFQDGLELIDPTTIPADCTGSWPGDPCGFDGVSGTADDPGICQIHDPNLGNNIILITYDLQIEAGVSPGDIVNTSSLLRYAGDEGGPNHLSQPLEDDATTSVDAAPIKYLLSTSETQTTGTDVAIGEVVRYRIVISIPESTTTNLQIRDRLPAGLLFLNDGTARVGFISNGGVSSASTGTLPIPAISNSCFVSGSTANASTPATLPCVLPDENIGSTSATNANVDTYAGGTDVFIKLGNITNTETDANTEYAVVELNALVHNSSTNQNDDGDTLGNIARVTTGVSNNQLGSDSSSVDVIVRESLLTLVKTVSDEHPAPGQIVTFTLVISNSGNAIAFDVDITDGIPSELTLDIGSIAIAPSGTVAGVTDVSTAGQVHVTATSMAAGSQLIITYDATVVASLNDIFVNDADTTWTSLQGTNGTLVNSTGSSAPGTPGSDTGERNGGGGQNDYQASDDVTMTADRNLVKNLITSNLASTTFPDVTIGEILTYQIVLTIPSGTDTAIITDTLDDGLAFVDLTSFVLSDEDTDAAGAADVGIYFSGSSTPVVATGGHLITFNLGNISNTDTVAESITITYRVIVLNTTPNVQDAQLDNDVDVAWGTGTVSASADEVEIVEPDLTIEKTVDPIAAAYGSTVNFSITIDHTSESLTTAYDVVVFDSIPTGLILTPGSTQAVTTDGGNGFPTGQLITETPTSITVRWDSFPLGAAATITFSAVFSGPAPVVNSANVEWATLQIDPAPRLVPQSTFNTDSTERRYDPLAQAGPNNYIVSSTASLTTPARLPRTGFAPGEVTILPEMPANFEYAAMSDLWLEIPSLGVKLDIVGVPLDQLDWNLTWLGNNAGYLEGTAYPTHAGNTAITAHAYLADGTAGPFASLEKLQYGDQIIVHMGGQKYIYEVRQELQVRPDAVGSVLRHEKYSWLTLITCKSYNEATKEYTYRSVARAVLIKVVDD